MPQRGEQPHRAAAFGVQIPRSGRDAGAAGPGTRVHRDLALGQSGIGERVQREDGGRCQASGDGDPVGVAKAVPVKLWMPGVNSSSDCAAVRGTP